MSEPRCPEECGGCPRCMGPAIELVEASERDEWKTRAEKAEAALGHLRCWAKQRAISCEARGEHDQKRVALDALILLERFGYEPAE